MTGLSDVREGLKVNLEATETGDRRQTAFGETLPSGVRPGPAQRPPGRALAVALGESAVGLGDPDHVRQRDSSQRLVAGDRADRRSRATWAVFAGAVAVFSALAAVYWKPADDDINDARYYMSLARHPFHFPRAPFGFRILTPYLVWLSHLSPDYAFTAVTILSLAAAAAFLYLYLREIYSAEVALFGVGLFVVCPAPLIELKNPVDVDSLFFAMVALSFLALARRHWVLLGVALVLGVLDKETMLFVLLPVAVVAMFDYRLRPLRRWAALFGSPILAFILLHYTSIVFRPVPRNYNYLSATNISFVFRVQHLINGGGPGYSFGWSMVDTFGALWVLALLLVGRADRLIRQSAILIVPVLASVLIATDWSRMLAVGFIVVIPLVCAAGLERPFASVVLFCSYAALVPLGLDNPRLHPTFAVFVPLLVACTGAALLLARPRPAARLAPSTAGTGPATAALGTPRVLPLKAPTPARPVPRVAQAPSVAFARPPRRVAPAAARPAPAPAPAARPERVAPAAARPAPSSPAGPPQRVAPAAARPAPAPVARPEHVAPAAARPAPAPPGPPERVAPAAQAPVPSGRPPNRSARVAVGTGASRAAARLRAAIPRQSGAVRPATSPGAVVSRESSEVRNPVPRGGDTGARPARPEPVPASSMVRAAPAPPPRSEAVVHLENAESLLADIQRLVARAAVHD